ncbi:YdcP family protein [Carnobacterium gallinarum]|uniref:YdcP family protein n=1 Tax=Carnobacterium gallinarum TaxID=2749 RepID=UPI00054FDF09|nr:YdcP family protein [Carnobacterium gallinarum]
MRLPEGITVLNKETFGTLLFSDLRREVFVYGEDGNVTAEVKERTYDLKSSNQGAMIQVGIPATVPLRAFPYNTKVQLVNPVVDTVANATFMGATVDWYIKADDIVEQTNEKATNSSTIPKEKSSSTK